MYICTVEYKCMLVCYFVIICLLSDVITLNLIFILSTSSYCIVITTANVCLKIFYVLDTINSMMIMMIFSCECPFNAQICIDRGFAI